jgi:Na+-transporting NADH:ubiquinone oxidoreductase subunit B
LATATSGGWAAVTEQYSISQMFWGTIPGSIGETSKPLIVIGALFLVGVGIASWRVMFGMIVGCAIMGLIFNAWDASPFMNVPWYAHFFMGSFLFAMAFMATDPVTAASTNTGKWIYGIFIGIVGLLIRVFNPGFPEGWMLAILFLNTFAPLIDYYVLEGNMKKRVVNA